MHRKLLPASLLYADGQENIIGRTRIQKLAFLIEMEYQSSQGISMPLNPGSFNFEPYDYGPFSKELYDVLEDMDRQGLIEEDEQEYREGKTRYEYELTEKGKDFVEDQLSTDAAVEILRKASKYKSEYNKVPLPDLIKYVYSEYPEYASESVYWRILVLVHAAAIIT